MSQNRIAQLQAFLQASPNDPFLHYALAMEHANQGDTAAALAGYRHLIAEHPTYVGTYYHYGKLLERLGEPALATEAYQTGIAVATQEGEANALRELREAAALLQLSLAEDENEDLW